MTLFVSYWCHQFTIMRLSPGATSIPHIWWGLGKRDISWPSQVHLLWTRSSQPCIPWIDQGAPSIGPWQVKVHLTWGTTHHFLVHICHWNDNQTCGRVIPAIKWDHITVSNILHIDKCNLKGYNLQFFLFLTHALYLLFLSFLHQICPSTYCGLAGRGLIVMDILKYPLFILGIYAKYSILFLLSSYLRLLFLVDSVYV